MTDSVTPWTMPSRLLFPWESPDKHTRVGYHALFQAEMQHLGANLRNDKMISVCFQGKPFDITVIQVYAPTTNAKKDEAKWFYEDLQDL